MVQRELLMFGVIREYKIQSGKADELVKRVRAEFVPTIEKAAGFVGYTLAQIGADGILTVSTFENHKQAEESVGTAAGWVKEHVASFVTGPPRVTMGELVLRHVVENAQPGYGVMRRIEGKPAEVEETTKQVREGLLPLLSAMPGFAYYALLREAAPGRGAALSAFADRATAEAANQRALAWVKEHLSDSLTKPIEVVAGDIKIRHLKATAAAH